MQSFGEIRQQPRTPCSASGECGGNRSMADGPVVALRRRVFFKSVGAPVSETESIIVLIQRHAPGDNKSKLFFLFAKLFAFDFGYFSIAIAEQGNNHSMHGDQTI